jgi:flagellar basal body-associated protein FliL
MAKKKSDAEPKSKKKMLMIVIPVVVLLVAAVGYKKVMMKPVPPPKMKVEGSIVPLANDFVVNLGGGHYGKVTVALLVTDPVAPSKGAGSPPPELPENAVIRAVITDRLTGLDQGQLVDRAKRQALLKSLVQELKSKTDTHVKAVYFTDIAVQ